MIQSTRWTLSNTCGCILHISWDDQADPATRAHTPWRIEFACEFHKHYSDKQYHYETVLKECGRLSHSEDIIKIHIDELLIVAEDGHKHIKEGSVLYSFDPDRNLSFIIHGIDSNKKAIIQKAFDDFFGKGKSKVI